MAGRHLTIEATVLDPKVFSHAKLSNFFIELAKILDMDIIFGPHFKDVELDPTKLAAVQAGGKFQDEGGTTGFVVISTSHISIHTWQMRNFFQLDVFSCKDFDAEKAINFIKENLGVDKATICNLIRFDEANEPAVDRIFSI